LCVFSPPHFCGCWNYFVIPLSQPQKRRLLKTLNKRKTYDIIQGIGAAIRGGTKTFFAKKY